MRLDFSVKPLTSRSIGFAKTIRCSTRKSDLSFRVSGNSDARIAAAIASTVAAAGRIAEEFTR